MQMTGILIGAAVAAWLLFLIPWLAKSSNVDTPITEEAEDDRAALVILHYGVVRNGVSTPADRDQALARIRQIDRRAARRRMTIFVLLLALTIGVFVASTLGYLPWFVTVFPSMLLVLFVGAARVSVTKMRAQFRRQIETIETGGSNEEQTIALDVTPLLATEDSETAAQVAIAPEITETISLWDAIPITKPTYVSAAIGPRTVRTVDMSFPTAPLAETESDTQRAIG